MNKETIIIEEPPIARQLFADPRLARLRLPLPLFFGWTGARLDGTSSSTRNEWIMERRCLATGREASKWRPGGRSRTLGTDPTRAVVR